jgi:hypothetical protein
MWRSDSLVGNSSLPETDDQQIYKVLLKMLDRWNAHDIDGYLEAYSKSSELLVIIDSERFDGWEQLHDSYVNGYPDRNAMGFIEPKRVQVKLLKSDLALALTWWWVSFPSSKQKVVGNTTMNLQKFDNGWKIVASHTSIAGMWFPIRRTRSPATSRKVSLLLSQKPIQGDRAAVRTHKPKKRSRENPKDFQKFSETLTGQFICN